MKPRSERKAKAGKKRPRYVPGDPSTWPEWCDQFAWLTREQVPSKTRVSRLTRVGSRTIAVKPSIPLRFGGGK